MEQSHIEEPEMHFDNTEYTEQKWRNDADARERAEERRLQRELTQDFDIETEGWQAKNNGGSTEPPIDLESQLRASIDHANAQHPAPRPSAAKRRGRTQMSAPEPTKQTNPSAIGTIAQTSLSQLLASCMIAAIDATIIARDYAQAKGLTVSPTEASIQDLATSLLVHVQRLAELECKYGVRAAPADARVDNAG